MIHTCDVRVGVQLAWWLAVERWCPADLLPRIEHAGNSVGVNAAKGAFIWGPENGRQRHTVRDLPGLRAVHRCQ